MTTMLDIAVRAGVSRSTVSFVLNEKHSLMGVNDETCRRVLQVADEMGYRRNGLARAIATGKAPIFCFLIYDFSLDSEVVSRIMNGIMDEADKCRHTVQVLRFSNGNNEDVVQRCVELRPAGALGIYFDIQSLQHLQQELARFSIPLAVLDSTPAVAGGSRILSDDIEGCYQAIEHLTALGHRRIAFVGGDPKTVVSQLREDGYRRAMARQDLDVLPGYLETGFWNPEKVDEAVLRIFRNTSVPPTALFCADDKTAMVACRALRGMGLHVPSDVSVVGYADLEMANYNDPPLTTIAQPFRTMGRTAVKRLLAAAEETDWKGESSDSCCEEWLPTRLVVRRSTAPANESLTGRIEQVVH